MTPAAFLSTARAAGVTLWDEGGVLRYRGPREAVEKLVPVLKTHKPVILKALAQASGEVDELREMFDGCARILEHLAGLSREEAGLEAGRIAGTLARNRRYRWESLRDVLGDYPELLARVPEREGVVDALPLGVARHAVLKDGGVVRQGEFNGSTEVKAITAVPSGRSFEYSDSCEYGWFCWDRGGRVLTDRRFITLGGPWA
jgi:hypothetical protein